MSKLIGAYVREIARAAYRRYPLPPTEVSRRFRPWWRTTRIHQPEGPIADRLAWITYAALDHLERHVDGSTRVFEYGAGGSTLYFLDHGADVVSVEHDERWAAHMRDIASDGWELHTIPPAVDERVPTGYGSHRLRGSFREYAEAIDGYGQFDVVFVDGRARSACLRHGADHVAPGGLLVLDNSERSIYRAAAAEIDRRGWERHDFFGPGPYNLFFWQTTIWSAT